MKVSVEKAFSVGLSAHQAGNVEAAEACYRAILKTNPGHAEANYNLGVLELAADKASSAIVLLETALKSKPTDESVWFSYICALIKDKNISTAHDAIKRAKCHGCLQNIDILDEIVSLATVNSDRATPSQEEKSILMRCYQAGDLRQAELLSLSFTQRYPNDFFGWNVLSAVLGLARRFAEAARANEIAVNLAPESAEAHSNLGNTYRMLGKLEEAKISLRKATSLSPTLFEAHNNLGLTLKALSQLSEAEECFRQSIDINKDFAEAHYHLANILKDQQRFAEAENSYRRAISITGDYPEALTSLGNTLEQLNRSSEAEACYTKAIALRENYPEAHYNLGLSLRSMNRLEEAAMSIEKAIAYDPSSTIGYCGLATIEIELGLFSKAETTCQRAISIDEDCEDAHRTLGMALFRQERLEEAVKIQAKAVAINPASYAAHTNLALTLEAVGDYEKAVFHNRQAFSLRTQRKTDPSDPLSPATTTLLFEITNKCNFHCTFCPSDSQERAIGFMKLGLIKRLYCEAAEKNLAQKVNLHLMGEPTLHPQLIEILEYGASKNIKTDLVTNISTLVTRNIPKILDNLYGTVIASHMTPTEETYQFRGSVGLSWERYIGNLQQLVFEYMKRFAEGGALRNDIIIRVMVTKNTQSNVIITDNEDEASSILKEWNTFVSESEIKLGLKPFTRVDHNHKNLLRGNKNSFVNYNLQAGVQIQFWRAFTFANTRLNDEFELEHQSQAAYCPKPFQDVGVLWNGDVTLCGIDHDGALKVGNVNESSIEDIIHSDSARELRSSMLGQRPLPLVCQTCQAKPIKRDSAAQ